jgi:hypothetical protein
MARPLACSGPMVDLEMSTVTVKLDLVT